MANPFTTQPPFPDNWYTSAFVPDDGKLHFFQVHIELTDKTIPSIDVYERVIEVDSPQEAEP